MKKKFFVSFLVSLIVFASIYGWFYYKVVGSKSLIQSIEAESNIDSLGNIEEGNKIKQINSDEILFLLVGVDTTDVNQIGVSNEGATGIRSDTMMLCKVNFNNGDIKIMSLPRDSRVPVRGSLDKLNHSHSYGGMKLLMKTIRDYTNLDIDYYVRVDYNAVREVVDAIGGVEVEITEPMKYSDTTEGKELFIDFDPGMVKLDGQKAIEYLRFRSYKEGDIRRVQNQQYFMKELIKQTVRPKNIVNLPKLIDVYSKYIDTNIEGNMVFSALKSAAKINTENIETLTLPGDGKYINGLSYYIIYEEEAKTMIKDNFSDYLME